MPNGSIRHTIYPVSLTMFKNEVEESKTYLSKHLTSYGIIRIQKTKKGNKIKLEKLDLSKVPLETEDDKRLKRIFEKAEKSRQK